jgi:hypothetical protein
VFFNCHPLKSLPRSSPLLESVSHTCEDLVATRPPPLPGSVRDTRYKICKLTKREYERWLLVKVRIVLVDLCKAFVDRVVEPVESGVVVFLLPCQLKLFDCWKSLPESGSFLCGKVLLDAVGVLWSTSVFYVCTTDVYFTASISQTSLTLSQLLSVMVNMAQGMCLSTWPLWRIVEIGP